jgi:protein-disulfide isomerase
MTDERRGVGRRGVVAGAAAGLSSLAGCASVIEQSASAVGGDGSTPQSGTGTSNKGADEAPSSDSSGHTSFHTSDDRSPLGIDLTGNPIEGAADAPVTMYYWSDFQCPFCKRFQENAYPKLAENEVSDGRLRIVYLEFPAIGQASKTAALMQKCVWRQVGNSNPDAYGRWHEAIYDEQRKENSGWAKRSNLLAYTQYVEGVDANKVDECLTERTSQMQSLVDDDVRQAKKRDVNVTPSFVFHDAESGNTTKLAGAQPYERYAAAVNEVNG